MCNVCDPCDNFDIFNNGTFDPDAEDISGKNDARSKLHNIFEQLNLVNDTLNETNKIREL